MNAEEVKQLIGRPDLDILYLCENGSRVYGWSTKNSDYDIKGIYLKPLKEELSLQPGADNIVYQTDEYDIELFELRKYLALLNKSNFNMVELLHSPIVYHEVDNIKEDLLKIYELAISQKLGKHAMGWSYSMYKMNWDEPKKCLMAIRPMIAYMHLLTTGKWESNLIQLMYIKNIDELVESLLVCRHKGLKTPELLKHQTLEAYDILKDMVKKTESKTWLREKPDKNALELSNVLLYNYKTKAVLG